MTEDAPQTAVPRNKSRGPLETWRLTAFAGPSIPIAAMGLPIGVYLPPFYATEMGLGLAAVGTVFMLARFWDVFTDPVMGVISDRVTTRWGRRRHWIVLAVPIMMVAAYMIFLPTAPVGATYLLGWLFLFYIGWTMLTLSHMSWGAELDPDYNQRSRIQAFREGALLLGVPLVLALPGIIEQIGGEDVGVMRVAAMGWFIILLLPVTVGLAVTLVPEREVPPPQHVPFREGVKVILGNRALRFLVVSDFLSGFSGAALGSMFIFFATYFWQVPNWASVLLLLYFFAGVGFIPIVLRLSYRFGKHRTLVGAALFNASMVPLVLLVPPGSPVLAGILMAFLGINVGSASMLYRSMMADVADLDEVESGQRRTGLYYSMMTLTQKAGGALAVGIVFWTLALIGFSPSGENTPEAIRGLSYVFVAVPMSAYLLVALLMSRFPIDLARQQELRRILEERMTEEFESDQRPVL